MRVKITDFMEYCAAESLELACYKSVYCYYFYYNFLTLVLSSQEMKKLCYAVQKSTKIKLE